MVGTPFEKFRGLNPAGAVRGNPIAVKCGEGQAVGAAQRNFDVVARRGVLNWIYSLRFSRHRWVLFDFRRDR
jgi:hypothetical protein